MRERSSRRHMGTDSRLSPAALLVTVVLAPAQACSPSCLGESNLSCFPRRAGPSGLTLILWCTRERHAGDVHAFCAMRVRGRCWKGRERVYTSRTERARRGTRHVWRHVQGGAPHVGAHRVSADACCGHPPPFPAALPPLLPRGRNSDSTDRGGAMSGKEQKWITVCGPAPTQPSLASLLSLLGTHPHSKRTTDYLSLRTIPGHRRAGRRIAEVQRRKGEGGGGSDKRGC